MNNALEKARETSNALKYYINNPSAWNHFDQSISDKIESVVNSVEALAAIDAEKPSDDAESLAKWIETGAHEYAEFWCHVLPQKLQQFAIEYHKRECGKCKNAVENITENLRETRKLLDRLSYLKTQLPEPPEVTNERELP